MAASSSVGAASVSTEKPQAVKTKSKNVAEPRAVASPPVIKASNKPAENISAFSDVGNGGSVRAASFRGQSSVKSSRSVGNMANQGVNKASKGGGSQGGAKSVDKTVTKPDNTKSADKAAAKPDNSKDGKEKR